MSPLDLSFRQKLPLWGSVLVILTAMAVSAALMFRAYAELEEDLAINARTFSLALLPTLASALVDDNVWRAFEAISLPLDQGHSGEHETADNVIVVDQQLRIFVSATPGTLRMQMPLAEGGPELAALADHLRGQTDDGDDSFRFPDSKRLYFVSPISMDGNRLGTLIVAITKASLMPRFIELAGYGAAAAVAVLCVLLPLNWYWGRRMADPLVQLSERMSHLGRNIPETLDPALYAHRDELGSLFKTYNKMLADLRAKEELERQMVQADRLAALGQLAAGVAHEINNPLGGMLMAIDTLKSHSVPDPRIAKTVDLIERGLGQIRETVGALLVEARVKSRDLTTSDIEDILLLVLPQAHAKHIRIDWHNEVASEVALPATLVRQVMINLLLNAVHAASDGGSVRCHVRCEAGHLLFSVSNDGQRISSEQMTHLFEPFSTTTSNGHGLGLWVSYQIVQQLGGTIGAARQPGGMQFDVALPTGGPTE